MDTETMKWKSILLDFWVVQNPGPQTRHCIVNLSHHSSETSNTSPGLVSIWAQPTLSVSLVQLPLYHCAPIKPQLTILWASPSDPTTDLFTFFFSLEHSFFAKFILYFMTKINSFMNYQYFLIIIAGSIFLSPSTSIVHYYYCYYNYLLL